jgi:hypothetical protein
VTHAGCEDASDAGVIVGLDLGVNPDETLREGVGRSEPERPSGEPAASKLRRDPTGGGGAPLVPADVLDRPTTSQRS